MPKGIYHFADTTLGIAVKNIALGLKPIGAALFIGSKNGISRFLEILCGMPEIQYFNIGIEG